MSECRLLLGDCLEVLPTLEAQSIDAIIGDLPYGTTACKWDEVIPFAPMWAEVKRVLKPRGAFVTTASQPFTSKLVMSNPKWFRCEWVWHKTKPVGYLNAKKMPLVAHENILIFAQFSPQYNPQKTLAPPEKIDRRKVIRSSHDRDGGIYGERRHLENKRFADDGTRYPTSVIQISNSNNGSLHPTQKPVALYEYLIRTYTNEGDTVLDFTMGSGTTGVACVQTGRNFIGIELDQGYFQVAERRIAEAQMQMPLLEVA